MRNLGVELIDLLERKTLGLVDHAPDEEDAHEAETAPDEEHLRTKIGIAWTGIDHVGSGATIWLANDPNELQKFVELTIRWPS